MEQKKNSPLFYEARDSIKSGNYLKAKTKILQRYLKELDIVQPWESDNDCWKTVERKHEWVQKIKTELQKRKDVRYARALSVARFCTKYILAPLVVLIVAYFVLRPFQIADQKEIKKQAQQTQTQQPKSSKPVLPANPTNKDNNQDNQGKR